MWKLKFATITNHVILCPDLSSKENWSYDITHLNPLDHSEDSSRHPSSLPPFHLHICLLPSSGHGLWTDQIGFSVISLLPVPDLGMAGTRQALMHYWTEEWKENSWCWNQKERGKSHWRLWIKVWFLCTREMIPEHVWGVCCNIVYNK